MPSEPIVTLLAFSPFEAGTAHVGTTCLLNVGMIATAGHGRVAGEIMLESQGVGE